MTDYTLEALKKQAKKLNEKQKALAAKIKEKEKKAQAKAQKKLEKKYLVAGEFFLNTVLQNEQIKTHYLKELQQLKLVD